MSSVQVLVGCVVLLAMAGGLIGSLRLLDLVGRATPRSVSPRPATRGERPSRHDDGTWPSYGWVLAEQALARSETTPVTRVR
ncbi:hypothetical protein [Nocardioides aurantiacus]|uniref:Uncharacterized protein n=1 Tax=Nocardioides aurantiacus TaxID=86796 RepID=A0A3N2CWG4_9ACTN|nr:hypothetical protein [Nocardioides aurantiacus]ROR91892.1 hypothetical protein EDD33_2772 [Nocardioides aurantiacus]